MKDMTHNNNQRRFSLKTQARKGTAALLSIALIAALTGCESLSYMGNAVQTAGGYAFDKAEAGYRAVEGLETKTVGRVRSSNFAQTRDEALSMKVQAKSLYLRASANGSGLTDESIESANKFLLSQGPTAVRCSPSYRSPSEAKSSLADWPKRSKKRALRNPSLPSM